MSNHDIHIRPATPDDQAFLDAMNVVASVEGRELPPFLQDPTAFMRRFPQAKPYSQNFGRTDDLGLVAVTYEGEEVGAVWGRHYERDEADSALAVYPFEITLGVEQAYRGQGVGRLLLTSFINLSQALGKLEIALGVKETNPARHLYESVGFVALLDADGAEARVNQHYVPMLLKLQGRK